MNECTEERPCIPCFTGGACEDINSTWQRPINDLLRLRIRKVGETMRADDVVLFDEMFMPIGFTTDSGAYYAGQMVTTSMSGKVICKDT